MGLGGGGGGGRRSILSFKATNKDGVTTET